MQIKHQLYLLVILTLFVFAMSSCSGTHQKGIATDEENKQQRLQKHNKKLNKMRQKERELEKTHERGKKTYPQPVVPSYNPLKETPISLSVTQEPLRKILYIISKNAGLNLVIDPEVSLDSEVTVNFQNTPSYTVMNKLLKAYNLTWEVNNNVLHIKKYIEETFQLGFLNTKTSVDINAGGNVLGEMGSGNNNNNNNQATNFSGQFKINSSLGKGVESGSIYHHLQNNIENILQNEGNRQEGYFTLDPTSGTLHIKASRSQIKTIAKMLNRLKEKMSHQVLIDARIIEVKLSDSNKLGIDWSVLTERFLDGKGLNIDLGWTGDSGSMPLTVVHGGDSNQGSNQERTSLSMAVQALQSFGDVSIVSSPLLRVKHNQSALFTSGSSQNYIRSVNQQSSYTDDNRINRESSVQVDTIFDGIMLGVVPFIKENQKVDLQIFPIKSQIDPGSLQLQSVNQEGDKISLPRVDVKNLSTNVRVRDGDTVILGGLIDKTSSESNKSFPGVSHIPILSSLLGSSSEQIEVREMVVIMKIRVVS